MPAKLSVIFTAGSMMAECVEKVEEGRQCTFRVVCCDILAEEGGLADIIECEDDSSVLCSRSSFFSRTHRSISRKPQSRNLSSDEDLDSYFQVLIRYLGYRRTKC